MLGYMQEKKLMKKICKTFLIVVSTCMLLISLSINLSCYAEETHRSPGLVSGSVYYSSDRLAKIYEEGNWSCINITTYCIDEYEGGIIDLAVDNGSVSVDQGEAHPDESYDELKFDPAYQWDNENFSKKHIAVGENEINGSRYVFITNFLYNLSWDIWGWCNKTEWEPISSPERYMYGSTWINISIPKFKNPQKELYGNLTTNADNTIGFAVYRDGIFVGNAIFSDETHYFFTDTNLSPGTKYTYRVAPIVNGGYVTYGKSSRVGMTTFGVTLNAPCGDEDWTGGYNHTINYTILYGTPDYTVELYYVNDTISIFIGYDNQTAVDTYEYQWAVPEIDLDNNVTVLVNIMDANGAFAWDLSDKNFTIDSTPPTVETTSPENNSSCSPSASIAVEFNESMNKTSVESAFSYTDGNKIWTSANGTINWTENVMQFTPDEKFEIGMQYNCTITASAKDDSDPGNAMAEDHTGSFVAAPGKGNFSIDVKYPPSTMAVGICQIKVTIINTVNAENRSGGLIVKFLKSSDGENFSIVDTELVPGMFPNNSTMVYANFSLSEGTWYLKVNISLLSPDDVIDDSIGYYETFTYTVNVVPSEGIEEEEREIGPGPYLLIALMVVIVVLIGIYAVWSQKKK